MRVLGLVIVALTFATGGALAFDSPKDLVIAIYAPYQQGQKPKPADLSVYYSSVLKGLFDSAGERDSVGPLGDAQPTVGPPPFDPFVSDENVLLHDLVIGEPQVLGDRALVTVRFHNFDSPNFRALSLLREADGWKVDDVSSMGSEENWLLGWLLLYDPLNN